MPLNGCKGVAYLKKQEEKKMGIKSEIEVKIEGNNKEVYTALSELSEFLGGLEKARRLKAEMLVDGKPIG